MGPLAGVVVSQDQANTAKMLQIVQGPQLSIVPVFFLEKYFCPFICEEFARASRVVGHQKMERRRKKKNKVENSVHSFVILSACIVGLGFFYFCKYYYCDFLSICS